MKKTVIATLMLAMGWAVPAMAEYPEKPITMIVAYSAGGSTDVTARLLAPFIEKYLGDGAKVVVENRPGAGGEVGFTAIANASPDGYTIGFVNTPNVLAIPIERETGYSLSDFDLLGNVVDDPGGFSVYENSKFKTLDDLVAFAKDNPGAVTVGSTGVGSDDHLAMLAFARLTGVQFTHVPFPGTSAVRIALAGNHISVGGINVGEATQAVTSGEKLINLGQMSAGRADVAPDLRTFREQGYDVISASLRGVAAPKGVPDNVRTELVDAIAKAVGDPEFQEQSRKVFAPVRFLTSEEHAKEFADLDAALRVLWKESPWLAK